MMQPQTEAETPQEGAEPPTPQVSGLACFMNQDRICGADCMAFLPQVPEGTAYTGEQWAHCHLLVNADRTGRHLVVLAAVGSKIAGLQRKADAEATRSQKPPGVPV